MRFSRNFAGIAANSKILPEIGVVSRYCLQIIRNFAKLSPTIYKTLASQSSGALSNFNSISYSYPNERTLCGFPAVDSLKWSRLWKRTPTFGTLESNPLVCIELCSTKNETYGRRRRRLTPLALSRERICVMSYQSIMHLISKCELVL